MVLIKNLIIAIVGIVLAVILYSAVTHLKEAPDLTETDSLATSTPPAPEIDDITYRNDTFGITFAYPESYVMSQIDAGNAERRHTILTLIAEEEASTTPAASEGPPAVAIDFYKNDLDKRSLTDWLKTADSNYTVGTSSIASTTISGVEAVQYQWTGLYQGETTAFLHKDNVVAVSVTYVSPEDQNVAVYRALLESIVLRQ